MIMLLLLYMIYGYRVSVDGKFMGGCDWKLWNSYLFYGLGYKIVCYIYGDS